MDAANPPSASDHDAATRIADSIRALAAALEEPAGETGALEVWEKRLGAARSLVLSAGVLLGACVLLYLVVAGACTRRRVLHSVHIPAALAEQGFGSEFFETGILASIRRIEASSTAPDAPGTRQSRSAQSAATPQLLSRASSLDLALPDTGLSVGALTQVLRETLGGEEPSLEGFVSEAQGSVELLLRVYEPGQAPWDVRCSAGSPSELVDVAAQSLVRALHPGMLLYHLAMLPDASGSAAAVVLAKEMLATTDDTDPEGLAWILGLEAYALMDLEDYAGAIACLRETLALHAEPRTAATNHASLGFALDHEGQWQEASEHYEQAYRLDPGYTHAYDSRGLALERLGRTAEALDLFHQALEIDPTYGPAIENHRRLCAASDCSHRSDPAGLGAELSAR